MQEDWGGGHFVIRRDFLGLLYVGFLGSLRFQFESLLLGVALSGFQVHRGGSQGPRKPRGGEVTFHGSGNTDQQLGATSVIYCYFFLWLFGSYG